MKPTDFYLDKASEYINSIDMILPNLLSSHSQGFDPTPEYKEQKQNISDLKLKTKLLFTEFDNGELFIKEIESIDKNIFLCFKTDELLKEYKHMLSLFIHHIKEFRN